MSRSAVSVGIVGLGRWAKVLTRAASKSDKIKIIAGYSRSEEKRKAFQREVGVPVVSDLRTMLSYPMIDGVILTVPNEQHPSGRGTSGQDEEARVHRKAHRPLARRGAG